MSHREPNDGLYVNRRALLAGLGGLALAPRLARAGEPGAEFVWRAAAVDGRSWPAFAGPAMRLAGAAREDLDGRAVVRFGEAGRYAELTEPLGDGWSALTVVCYAYLEQPKRGYQGLVCRDRTGGAEGDVWALLVTPEGQWSARAKTTAGQVAVSAPAAPGWHQVALVHDGQAVGLFVDGVRAGAAPAAGSLVAEPGTPLCVGCYSTHDGPFAGAVSAVEIHRAALDEARLAAAWRAWQQEAGPITSFTFAQGSDLHVHDTRSIEIVNDAVDLVNANPRVAFSLWLGDLTQESTPESMFLAHYGLARLRRPWYAVRGNHDLAPGVYEQYFGPLMQAIDFGGWRFLLCDSNPGDDVPMADAQQAWLREQLAATPAEMPLALCCHHPLMPHTKAYHLAGAEQVVGLFDGRNLKAVLNGHYHGNQEETVDGVLYTTTACCSTTRTNFDGTTAKGYRLFQCTADGISTEFVTVRDGA